MRQVYLDHQASTPVLPEVMEAMRPYFTGVYGSSTSLHAQGLRVRDALAKARQQVAGFVNAGSEEEIIFTSSGTESVNLAIKGVVYANQSRGKHIVTTAIEHPAVLNSIEWLETQGFSCTRVKVDSLGRVSPAEVEAAVTGQTVLICVHLANHDIGTIQPVREIATIAQARGIPLLVDCNASAGWLPVDVRSLGASLATLAPHRFYGPKGVGVLYRSRRVRMANLIHGGVQEGGRRAGTENIPGIVGAGVAAEIAKTELEGRIARTAQIQKHLWEGFKKAIPYIQLNGPEPGAERVCTNMNISIEFVEGEGLVLMADTRGIAFTSGTACVSKAIKVSPVLGAIGVEHALALGAIIMSLGKDNTEEEADYVLEVLPKLVERLRGMSPTWEDFQRGIVKSGIKERS